MQSADKYYFNYLAKFIADNRYYRDNFEKIIDYRDKKNCTDNGNPNLYHYPDNHYSPLCSVLTLSSSW